MQIVSGEYPPLIDAIDAAFKVRGKPVIYTWGDKIYNPMFVPIWPQLVRHEEVHCGQQSLGGPYKWWELYIIDPEFRLAQEIPAHKAEYQELLRLNGDNRRNRRVSLARVAARLAAPLYGGLVSVAEAKKLLHDDAG